MAAPTPPLRRRDPFDELARPSSMPLPTTSTSATAQVSATDMPTWIRRFASLGTASFCPGITSVVLSDMVMVSPPPFAFSTAYS
jgi:hypothetical protein